MIITILESLLKSAVHFINALLLAAVLELMKTLSHLLANLLGGLKVCHEFLLIHAVLGVQKLLQSI